MTTFCGYIALIGRPNVGKSTLLNQILQQKLSITSRKPQTTRHTILGIKTLAEFQFVYVDTPGIHQNAKKAINRMMNKAARTALQDVDVLIFMLDKLEWCAEDEYILHLIKQEKVPCILVINKIDQIADKTPLLPWMESMQQRHQFQAIIPLSAKNGQQVDVLEETIKSYLPSGPHLFEEDQFTDRPIRFLCAELLREKIFRFCGQELPYATTVEIESFKEEEKLVRIHALILVDKENQKRIVIGDNGLKLKEIATQARLDMEKLLDKKVFLQCWCKVKAGWSDDERLLKQLGHGY